MREKLERAAFVLNAYSVLLAAASLFSIPFPFARQLWIREIWGISGLIQAFFFYLIAQKVKKGGLSWTVAGIGPVINEQILAWRTFWILYSRGEAHQADVLFLAASSLLGLLMAVILIDAAKQMIRFRNNAMAGEAPAETQIKPFKNEPDEISFWVLAVSVFGYLAAFGLLGFALYFSDQARYGILKILSVLISLFSFFGIGLEISFYLSKKQSRFYCGVKIANHLLLLALVCLLIYSRLPVASVLIPG